MTYAPKKGAAPKMSFNMGSIKFKPHPKKQTAIVIDKPDGHHFFFKCKDIEDKLDWLRALEAAQFEARNENEVVINKSAHPSAGKARALTVTPNSKKIKIAEEVKGDQSEEEKTDNDELDVADMDGDSPNNGSSKSMTSPGILKENQVISKDDILESMSKIFYETQMLSNNSPVTSELVAIENSASSIQKDLKDVLDLLNQSESEAGEAAKASVGKITAAIQDASNLRLSIEKLVNSFEGIRASLYPVAEKIALIELEKNPYRIPGGPYKRIRIQEIKVACSLLSH